MIYRDVRFRGGDKVVAHILLLPTNVSIRVPDERSLAVELINTCMILHCKVKCRNEKILVLVYMSFFVVSQPNEFLVVMWALLPTYGLSYDRRNPGERHKEAGKRCPLSSIPRA